MDTDVGEGGIRRLTQICADFGMGNPEVSRTIGLESVIGAH
jgi:hypothetical protein